MNEKDIQWLLSLSLVSLLGPWEDVDFLTSEGFYRKSTSGKGILSLELPKIEGEKGQLVACFLEEIDITDQEKFEMKLSEITAGRGFSANVQKLMQLGRTMGPQARAIPKSFLINGHPFLYDFFQVLMQYEFHWPENGFAAYDLANQIMMTRVGRQKGWMSRKGQLAYFEEIIDRAREVFSDYKTYGREAVLCRHIHCQYLKIIGSTGIIEKDALSLAWFGLWQYL